MGSAHSADEFEKVGYRILGVQPNSPGAECGFVSFFDFIVAANGVPLLAMDSTFVQLIKTFEGNSLELTIYNYKSHTFRSVSVTPSRNWPGEGFLGVIIRFDTFHDADEYMCHVLDVEANSPAELAGLQPDTDYLLGTTDLVFKDSDVLFDVLNANIDKPFEIYVFNSETDEVRIAVLMPTTEWGGHGILGASVACGYLHTLPSSVSNTTGKSYEGSIRGLQSPFGYNNTAYAALSNSNTDAESEITTQSIPSSSSAATKSEPITNAKVVPFGLLSRSHDVSVGTSGIVEEVSNDVIGTINVGEAQASQVAPITPRSRSIFSTFFDGNPHGQDQ